MKTLKKKIMLVALVFTGLTVFESCSDSENDPSASEVTEITLIAR